MAQFRGSNLAPILAKRWPERVPGRARQSPTQTERRPRRGVAPTKGVRCRAQDGRSTKGESSGRATQLSKVERQAEGRDRARRPAARQIGPRRLQRARDRRDPLSSLLKKSLLDQAPTALPVAGPPGELREEVAFLRRGPEDGSREWRSRATAGDRRVDRHRDWGSWIAEGSGGRRVPAGSH